MKWDVALGCGECQECTYKRRDWMDFFEEIEPG